MTEKRDVLTTQQAAILLGVSITSVQKMATNGELDGWITPGGHRRIFRNSVAQLLNSRNLGLAGVTGRLTLRILLVEDDHLRIASLKALLKRTGHSVQLTIIDDVKQALNFIWAIRPDLLIIDLDSEPVGGLKLVQAMEDKLGMKGPDVIALMTLSLEEFKEYGRIPNRVVRFENPLNAERLCGYLDALTVKLLELGRVGLLVDSTQPFQCIGGSEGQTTNVEHNLSNQPANVAQYIRKESS